MDPALADILVCPATRQRLTLADASLLAEVDESSSGRRADAALVREDATALYPVYGGIPALFVEDAIPLSSPRTRPRGTATDAALETGFSGERLQRLAELERWHFWFVGRRKLVDRLVRRRADGRPQLLLDVGCGTGATLDLLAERGHRVVGLDTDLDGLIAAAARRSSSPWLVRGDGARLPFGVETFDGVAVMDVLEHVDDDAVLADIRRVLKPGGWVLVTVPAMPWLWSHADEVAGHRRRYTRRTLSRLVERTGFELEEVSHYQFLLFPLVALTRLLGREAHAVRELEQRPSRSVNAVLSAITNLEVKLGETVRWPWGSSVVAFCRKA